jgi:hypothetical protein
LWNIAAGECPSDERLIALVPAFEQTARNTLASCMVGIEMGCVLNGDLVLDRRDETIEP